MIPTYEAAVAAGDCGRLCVEGFILFSYIHMATKEQQENFWTKLAGMSSIWSKQNRPEINYLPDAEYWVHPSSMEPNRSADHARAAAEPPVGRSGPAARLCASVSCFEDQVWQVWHL